LLYYVYTTTTTTVQVETDRCYLPCAWLELACWKETKTIIDSVSKRGVNAIIGFDTAAATAAEADGMRVC